jgi:hypothetical protein
MRLSRGSKTEFSVAGEEAKVPRELTSRADAG